MTFSQELAVNTSKLYAFSAYIGSYNTDEENRNTVTVKLGDQVILKDISVCTGLPITNGSEVACIGKPNPYYNRLNLLVQPLTSTPKLSITFNFVGNINYGELDDVTLVECSS